MQYLRLQHLHSLRNLDVNCSNLISFPIIWFIYTSHSDQWQLLCVCVNVPVYCVCVAVNSTREVSECVGVQMFVPQSPEIRAKPPLPYTFQNQFSLLPPCNFFFSTSWLTLFQILYTKDRTIRVNLIVLAPDCLDKVRLTRDYWLRAQQERGLGYCKWRLDWQELQMCWLLTKGISWKEHRKKFIRLSGVRKLGTNSRGRIKGRA